jgi:hypothetical protein
MGKWPILTIAALLTLSCGQAQKGDAPGETASPQEAVAPVAETISGKFDAAMTSIAEGDIGRGAGSLLDITLLAGPEAELPEGFKDAIERARAAFAADEVAAGREHVGAALKIWDPEKEKATPAGGAEAETPGPVSQLFRDKIVAARDLMARGEAKSAVTSILEALLLLAPARGS